jgi:hypothetical protein
MGLARQRLTCKDGSMMRSQVGCQSCSLTSVRALMDIDPHAKDDTGLMPQ